MANSKVDAAYLTESTPNDDGASRKHARTSRESLAKRQGSASTPLQFPRLGCCALFQAFAGTRRLVGSIVGEPRRAFGTAARRPTPAPAPAERRCRRSVHAGGASGPARR